MEIKGDSGDKVNIIKVPQPPVQNTQVDDIEVDLTSKPNLFSRPVPNNVKPKATNPIKRLNTFDNDFLPQENQAESVKKPFKNIFQKPDFNHLTNQVAVAFKSLMANTPVINYFLMKDKQSKLKKTLNTLNAINSDVDELINLAVPYGEQSDKYKMLCENLVKANQIHSQIRKEIQS